MGNLINVIFVFFPGKMDEKKEEDKEIEVIKPRTYQVKSTFIKKIRSMMMVSQNGLNCGRVSKGEILTNFSLGLFINKLKAYREGSMIL